MSDDLKRALAHVYWIGGAPCSGKSSIVEWLVRRHGVRPFSCDAAFEAHSGQILPAQHPAWAALQHGHWDEVWMRPLSVLVQDEWDIYRREFALIVQDLLRLPADRPIVVEGAALLPHCVYEVLARPRQAVWVIPDEAFQRRMYPRRGEWVQDILRQCTYPEQAFQNWMDRDAAFARRVEAEARSLGLAVLVVDGVCSLEDNAARVKAQFGWEVE